MLEVDIEKIIPITEARDSFNQIIEGVEASDDLFVVTKNGKPSAIIVGVHHLEKLTGAKLSTDELNASAAQGSTAQTAQVSDDSTQAQPVVASNASSVVTTPADDDLIAPITAPAMPAMNTDTISAEADKKVELATEPALNTETENLISEPSVEAGADTDALASDLFDTPDDDLLSNDNAAKEKAPEGTEQAASATTQMAAPSEEPTPSPVISPMTSSTPAYQSPTPAPAAPQQNPPTTSI